MGWRTDRPYHVWIRLGEVGIEPTTRKETTISNQKRDSSSTRCPMRKASDRALVSGGVASVPLPNEYQQQWVTSPPKINALTIGTTLCPYDENIFDFDLPLSAISILLSEKPLRASHLSISSLRACLVNHHWSHSSCSNSLSSCKSSNFSRLVNASRLWTVQSHTPATKDHGLNHI